jgi:hypothetical protein
MTKLRERFSQLCQRTVDSLRAMAKSKPVPRAPQAPEQPARDLLTRGAGKIHKIGKPFHWGAS